MYVRNLFVVVVQYYEVLRETAKDQVRGTRSPGTARSTSRRRTRSCTLSTSTTRPPVRFLFVGVFFVALLLVELVYSLLVC